MILSIGMACVAGIGFALSSLLAIARGELPAHLRAYAVAGAAAILLALALGDLFPESLESAHGLAVPAFLAGFALLFATEAFTHAHTHHVPEEHVHRHPVTAFVLGLGLHNLADGFAIGISTHLSSTVAALVAAGILIHQIPVGLSFAAVLTASHVPRRRIIELTVVLSLAIPFAAVVTLLLPFASEQTSGVLTGVAGGAMTYMAASHLLPEAQAEHPGSETALVFIGTLAVLAVGMQLLAH